MKSYRVLLRMTLLLSVITFGAAAWAQNTGSITGTVKDSSGAAVAGATVLITNAEHGINRQTVTNSSGDYNESALPAGKYDVVVSAGTRQLRRLGLDLRAFILPGLITDTRS